MKIAYHHRTRGRLAEGIHILELIRAFRSVGHDVVLLSMTERAPGERALEREEDLGRIRSRLEAWLRRLFPILYVPVGLLYLVVRLRREACDVLYERYALYNLAGLLAARWRGIPFILEVNSPYAHQTDEYEPPLFPWLARWCERMIIRNASLVVTVSCTQRDYLAALGAPPQQVHVVRNAVDLDRFRDTISGDEIRERYRIGGRFVIGFVGGLRAHHGLGLVLGAMDGMRDENMAFLVVGEGKERFLIEEEIDRLGLDNVILTGAVPHAEVPGYIAAMDVAVKPRSNSYCSPLKVFEYMAMRVPVVAGTSPSIAEIIEDGVNGRLVKPTVESLREAMRELINAPALRERLADAAYERIRDRTWTANARRVTRWIEHELNS